MEKRAEKNEKRIKRLKRRINRKLKKHVLAFVFAQIVILLLFVPDMINQKPPITLDDTTEKNVVIEKVRFIRGGPKSSDKIDIITSDGKYRFPNIDTGGNYSNRKLKDLLSEGDVITIRYKERLTVFGRNLVIADARTENEVYRTFDEFKKQMEDGFYLWIGVFVLVELVYAAVLFVVLLTDGVIDDIRGLHRRLSKRKSLKKQ